jgi:hypothetical protein
MKTTVNTVQPSRFYYTNKIMKNDSGISGEHNISPATENLYPYLDSVSPEVYLMSPDDQDNTK